MIAPYRGVPETIGTWTKRLGARFSSGVSQRSLQREKFDLDPKVQPAL